MNAILIKMILEQAKKEPKINVALLRQLTVPKLAETYITLMRDAIVVRPNEEADFLALSEEMFALVNEDFQQIYEATYDKNRQQFDVAKLEQYYHIENAREQENVKRNFLLPFID